MGTKSTRPPIIGSLEPSASRCSLIKLSRNVMVNQSGVLPESALSGERERKWLDQAKASYTSSEIERFDSHTTNATMFFRTCRAMAPGRTATYFSTNFWIEDKYFFPYSHDPPRCCTASWTERRETWDPEILYSLLVFSGIGPREETYCPMSRINPSRWYARRTSRILSLRITCTGGFFWGRICILPVLDTYSDCQSET